MTTLLQAPFPYFGGKRKAASEVWQAFGPVDNYVEPFAGSAAMLLAAPDQQPSRPARIETINDADGFVANFWRAIAHDPEATAHHADWPCNEVDLFSRHSWLVRQTATLTERLHADPDWFDAKIAGWWCWGLCNWIGSGWCSGTGPWVHDGQKIIDTRQLPHLGDAGQGINRKLPHLGNVGINRKLPEIRDSGIRRATDLPRREFIRQWFTDLHHRLRNVRVCCGDWGRVVKDSVTTLHGLTGVFLDPPYTKGAMQYAAGGVGTSLPLEVQAWAQANGHNPQLRIVLCGHAGEHDALLAHGWHTRAWVAGAGYARTEEAIQNRKDETLWCSPHCVPSEPDHPQLF